MSTQSGKLEGVVDATRGVQRRRFLRRAALVCFLLLVALNATFFWKLRSSVPHSNPLDLSRRSRGSPVELRGLFPGLYHLAIEFALPADFENAERFYLGSGAERIREDLAVDLEFTLTDENGRSLLQTDAATRSWKVLDHPHLEHADGRLAGVSFEAAPFGSYVLRTAVLRGNPAAAPYRAFLVLYADGLEYLGIEAAIYTSLLLIASTMIVVLVWSHRFGETDEGVPSLPRVRGSRPRS